MANTTATSFFDNNRSLRLIERGPSLDDYTSVDLIDPKVEDEDREIATRMIHSSYDIRERSVSLVGSFFPSAKSEASSDSCVWNRTNPNSPLDISSLFPATESETDASSLFYGTPSVFSRSNSIMGIFPPARSQLDSPEYYEILVRSRSIPSSYSIMLIFPPANSQVDSPDYYEMIDQNRHIPSYDHFFPPPNMSDIDSSVSTVSTPKGGYQEVENQRGSEVEHLLFLDIKKLRIKEVQKIKWNSLKVEMEKWIQFVKIVVRLILNSKKSESREIRFNKIMKGCVMQLLSFGKAVAIGRKSPQKLFGILDMYDAMAEALPQLEGLITDNVVINKVKDVLNRLGEAARGTFPKLENAVYNGTSVKFMQSGEIDPLSRYVMGYVQSLLDYSDTLNLLLRNIDEDDDQLEALTPLGRQLLVLITCLQFNLQKKSKLYEDDDALQYIFLMNNTLYIVQKAKDLDLGGFLGDNWVHKHHKQVRQYATSYHKASWTEVLLCLKDEGVGQSFSNASNRFKNFNASFEEVYRVQTAWKVPDAQLRRDLRISIMENVIMAYRSLMGMLGNQVESGRYAEKYIKYTADDLESYLLDLFEGSPRILLKKYIE